MEKYFDFVSIPPDVWSMIFQWCNLLILFLLVRHFLFKPVQKILNQREQEVGEMYEKAEAAETNAKAMEAEYTEKLADARNEAGRIMQTATKDAQIRGEEIVREAEEKAAATLVKAEERIEQERKSAVAQIQGQVAEMAVAIAEKVIEKELDPKKHEKLIEDFISSEVEG
ncbi:MAG: F0F1 ATP synthase subunit B [Clostridia bacterium]